VVMREIVAAFSPGNFRHMDLPSSFVIPDDSIPDRADKILAECLAASASRSSLARVIRSGRVLVKGRPISPSTVLNPGDRIEILPETTIAATTPDIEPPSFGIIFEDEDLIVVDKPPGLVVHPGAGRPSNTLMDILISTRPEMVGVGEQGRWGVVHRLDRDTSGVMVFTKTASAHSALSAQFKAHSIHRVYLALVRGNPGEESGIVDAPIGRHVKERKRISTKTGKARRAVTRWTVKERFGGLTLLEVYPETGRTHQIRVHLAFVGLPVAGDAVYGKVRKKSGVTDPRLRRVLEVLKRQALHAAVLGFTHPRSEKYVEFSSPMPADMAEAIKICGTAWDKAVKL
jgi:23S rRNA pseudouridine1911/1915/1917 synthase